MAGEPAEDGATMTTSEHLEAGRIVDDARRERDGKAYREMVLLRNENAVLRSTIEKLERDIEALKCSLDFYINEAAERKIS